MSLETKKRVPNIFIFKHFDPKQEDEAIMAQRVTKSEIDWKGEREDDRRQGFREKKDNDWQRI